MKAIRSFASIQAISEGVLGVHTAEAKFSARCVDPRCSPESTSPPYPVLCAATPSRENRMVLRWSHTGEAEKLKQKSIQGKKDRADSQSHDKEPASAKQRQRRASTRERD